MEIRHRILEFNNSPKFDLLKVELDKISATYDIKLMGRIGSHEMYSIEFTISETDARYSYVRSLITKYRLYEQEGVYFSDQDFASAERFNVVAGEYQYPEGENGSDYLEATYDISDYCNKCGTGKIQNRPFRLKRDFKQRTNQFLGLHWVFDVIFVRPVAKSILEKEELFDLEFIHPVLAKTGESIETVYQMKVNSTLAPGLCQAWHNDGNSKGWAECPFCGRKKSLFPRRDAIRFEKKIFNNAPDIAYSHECFGAGIMAVRLVLVSRRFYDLVQQKKLKGLKFTPILLM